MPTTSCTRCSCSLLIFGTIGLAFRLTAGPRLTRFVLLALGVSVAASAWAPRPQIVTQLGLVLLLWLLCRERLRWIPPLFLIWANAHGGVALGGLLLVMVSAAALLRWRHTLDPTDRRRALQLVAISALSGLLTTADHRARMDYLLYRERASQAKRFSTLGEAQSLYKAWAGLIARARNVDALISAVDKSWAKDPAYLFIRLENLRRKQEFEAAAKLIEQEYPPDQWNIYPFHFSDGDNWSMDDTLSCIEILRKQILPEVNMFAYGQVESPYGSGQFIKDLREHLGEDPRVVTSEIEDKNAIVNSIKDFLGKGN